MDNKTISVVVALNDDKGFGFIAYPRDDRDQTEEGGYRGRDIFFSAKEVSGGFRKMFRGQKVQFRLEQWERGEKWGLTAQEIELLEFTSDDTEERHRYEIATSTDPAVIVSAFECTAELMRYIAKHPEDLDRIHASVFEEIVAAIFQSEGFETERITSWNQPDGGVDLIAIRRLGSENPIRIAIQCKRYLRDRRISAEPIRSLAGVLDRFHAHVGVVATTTYFTRPAKEEVARHIWRISLRDYDNIVASLRRLDLLRQ